MWTDDGRTDAGPWVSYKLTSEPSALVELKMKELFSVLWCLFWHTAGFLVQQIEFSAFITRFNKVYLVDIFSLYKTNLEDPWVRQKRDQHVLQNTD